MLKRFYHPAFNAADATAMAQKPMDKMWGDQKVQNRVETHYQRGQLFDYGNRDYAC